MSVAALVAVARSSGGATAGRPTKHLLISSKPRLCNIFKTFSDDGLRSGDDGEDSRSMIAFTRLTAFFVFTPMSTSSASSIVTSKYPPGSKTRLHSESMNDKEESEGDGRKRKLMTLKNPPGNGNITPKSGWWIFWWFGGRGVDGDGGIPLGFAESVGERL